MSVTETFGKWFILYKMMIKPCEIGSNRLLLVWKPYSRCVGIPRGVMSHTTQDLLRTYKDERPWGHPSYISKRLVICVLFQNWDMYTYIPTCSLFRSHEILYIIHINIPHIKTQIISNRWIKISYHDFRSLGPSHCRRSLPRIQMNLDSPGKIRATDHVPVSR